MHLFSSTLKGLMGAVIATVMLACPGAMGVAAAHDVVLHSTPEDGATVNAFPKKIVLEFSAIPKETFNTVAVSDADDGTVLFTATPERDKQFMSVVVPEDVHPGPGHYIVGFQITSSDGHATRGKTTFNVAAASASSQATSGQVPAAENTPSADIPADRVDSGPSLGLIVALMALVAVCAGVVMTIKKRK